MTNEPKEHVAAPGPHLQKLVHTPPPDRKPVVAPKPPRTDRSCKSRCFKCWEVGHVKAECPNPRRKRLQ